MDTSNQAIVTALADEIKATSGLINSAIEGARDAALAGGLLLYIARTIHGAPATLYPVLLFGSEQAPKPNSGKGKILLTAKTVALYLVRNPEVAKTWQGTDLSFTSQIDAAKAWAQANGIKSRESLQDLVTNRVAPVTTKKSYPERFAANVTKAVMSGELGNSAEAAACGKAVIVAMGRLDLVQAFLKAAQAQAKELAKAVVVNESKKAA